MKACRILAAGLLAGLVMNVGEFVLNAVILADAWDAAMADLGLEPMAGGSIGVLIVMTFVTGIALIWAYAAMRPRFGPGPRTAIYVGLFAWFFVSLWPFLWNHLVPIYPSRLMTCGLAWSFFEIPIATLVGAWAYKETPAAATSTV